VERPKYLRLTMPSGDWTANGFTNNVWSDEPGPSLPADVSVG